MKTARLMPSRILVTSRGSAATLPPASVRGRFAAGCGPVPRPFADAVRALEADRGADHAVRADRPLAAGAADARLPVRVPVAAGQARRVPAASCGLPGAWSIGHASFVRRRAAAARHDDAPPLARSVAVRTGGAVGSRAGTPGQASAGLDDDRLDDHVLHRAVGARVGLGAAAMASTTFLPASSVTSPKIVCLPVSQAVGDDGHEELRAVGARARRWPSPAGTACRRPGRGGTRRRTRSPGRPCRCPAGRRPGS